MPLSNRNKWEAWLNKWFVPLLIIGVLVNATGLFITILDSDGTLYACIAKTIAQTNDFVNLKVVGKDWLDKPHFPFWMAAISYKLFGINTFAYKIPALLFWAMGGTYTFALAQKVYDKNIARISVLMYVTATHLFISNNDVRAEPYLTGLLIAAVYHFYIANLGKQWFKHILFGAMFTGCAMMTKGPFILIPIGGGLIAEWIINKEWKQFYSPKWYLALALVGIFTIPEIYCLYQQFDLHPEKIVFDKTGVSGVRFFFWDSQFGRFFNNGPIKGDGDPFFYVHTLIWAFLPWSLLFYFALVWKIGSLRAKLANNEYVTLFAGVLMFLVFSLSKFQLPHYLNILFPFFCITTAQYLLQLSKPTYIKAIRWIQYVFASAMFIVMVLLICFYRPERDVLAIAIVAITASLCLLFFNKDAFIGAFAKSYVAAVGVFAFLNLCMYPSLMQYQSGSVAAFYANEHYADVTSAAMLNENSYSFTFYTKAPIIFGDMDSLKAHAAKAPMLIYTNRQGLDTLRHYGFVTYHPVAFNFFHTSELTGEFIYFKTRGNELKQHYLVKTWLKATANH